MCHWLNRLRLQCTPRGGGGESVQGLLGLHAQLNQSQSDTKALVLPSRCELVMLHGAPTGSRNAWAAVKVRKAAISIMRVSLVGSGCEGSHR